MCLVLYPAHYNLPLSPSCIQLDIRETQKAAIQLFKSKGYKQWGSNPSYASVAGKTIKGLYFYKNYVINLAKELTPSDRGELEITDLNIKVLENKNLKAKILDSVFWLDTGTHDALVEASNFIKTVENREGKKVSCLEEIAYKYNYINTEQLRNIIENYNNEYGNYLKKLIK